MVQFVEVSVDEREDELHSPQVFLSLPFIEVSHLYYLSCIDELYTLQNGEDAADVQCLALVGVKVGCSRYEFVNLAVQGVGLNILHVLDDRIPYVGGAWLPLVTALSCVSNAIHSGLA
ncbi:MAG: hypothetical protein ACX933_07710 [Marinobacter adhaerens]